MEKKKIVFWGSTHPQYELYCPNWIGVKKGLKEVAEDHLYLCCRSDPQFVQKTIDFNPDLVICGLTNPILEVKPLEKIRKALPNAQVVFWYGDLRTYLSNKMHTDCSKLLDAMFVSNDGQESFWKRTLNIEHVFFLPLGCTPIEEPIIDKRFAFDSVFIGCRNFSGDFAKRAMLINDFEIAGVKRIDSADSALRAKIYQAMPSIYSSSKVVLDISHYTDIPGYTSVRYWEIPAFFGFGLTARFPRCEEFYPESIHAYFDTFEEALDKIKYYVEHDKERKEMVQKAHAHSYNHTHVKRLEQMFNILETI